MLQSKWGTLKGCVYISRSLPPSLKGCLYISLLPPYSPYNSHLWDHWTAPTPILVACQTRHHNHLWDHCRIGQLRALCVSLTLRAERPQEKEPAPRLWP